MSVASPIYRKIGQHSNYLLHATVVFFTLMPGALGQISGSAHDFSTNGWSGGRLCIVCHVSHDADQTVPNSPLWNHEASNVTYILYASPTLKYQPEQPRGPSLLCLSCHDGVTAIDSFGGNSGSLFMTGPALIGTDLSNDHPISIYWDHQTGQTQCDNCHDSHNPGYLELPFFDHYMECSTCHDVHNGTGLPKMLRKPLADSNICLTCHGV